MERIILILGDSYQDIKRTLVSNYLESVEVVESFRTPTDFVNHYKDVPVRVDRIIVTESSFREDTFNELQALANTLDSFSVSFTDVYFLITNDEKTGEILDFYVKDENYKSANKTRVFNHESYTSKLVIDYCLNKISRKHFIGSQLEFEQIVRKKKDGEHTLKLNEDGPDNADTDLVVLESEPLKVKDIQTKLANIQSLSNIVINEEWSNNPIIKDIMKIDELMSLGKKTSAIKIDYTRFFLKDNIKGNQNNLYVVTGEKRSGKSVMAYALAVSASKKMKTLVVDFDVNNLGLSHIAETSNRGGTYMLLQDFQHDFKNSLRTLVKSNKNFCFIANNTATLTELGETDAFSLLKLIIMTTRKYFDCIIFDIDIELLNEVNDLLSSTVKTIVTVPTNLNNIMSTVSNISKLEFVIDGRVESLVFTPVSLYKPINTIVPLEGPQVSEILKAVIGPLAKVTPEIEINSFSLDESLFKAIKTI